MQKKIKVIIILLLILAVSGLTTHVFLHHICVENENDITVTDMLGRDVKIPSSASNIVATSPPMTTVLYMLAPDKLKAVNFEWTDYELEHVPNKYKNYPVVGGWFGSQDGNYEEFIEVNPDIVIESVNEGSVGELTVNERQEKFGPIPVVGVKDTSDLKKIDESITFMGEIVGVQDKAKELTDFNDKYLNMVQERSSKLSDKNKKTVYYAKGADGLQTGPANSTPSQLIDLIGGKNVVESINQGNSTSNIQVSIEQVMEWNPDVIITIDPEFYAEVYKNPKWAKIDAVKNKNVFLSPQSPFKWFGKPAGANLIIGIPWTAKVIYPDDYKDIDMVDTTKEFYKKFYHCNLSDDEAKQILLDSGLKEANIYG